jgi:hypothetical protein
MAYNICNAAGGLCFDSVNKSTAAGGVIDESPRNGNDSQKFFIERLGRQRQRPVPGYGRRRDRRRWR